MNADDYRAYVGGTSGLIYGYVNDGFYTVDDFESFDANRVLGIERGCGRLQPVVGYSASR